MNTSPKKALPPRVAEKQNLSDWPLDRLLTLPEAAALCRVLSTRNLRHARKVGQLATVTIARKIFTSRRSLEAMARCERETVDRTETTPKATSFDDLVRAKTAAVRILPPRK